MKRSRLIILIAVCCVVTLVVIWRSGIYAPQAPQVQRDAAPVVDVEANEPSGEAAPADTNEPNSVPDANAPADANEVTEPNDALEAINLKDVEMKDIIQKLADWTGKVVIPNDEAMKQKLTIYSPKKLPRDQALQMIYSALQAKGFIAEQTDDVIYLKPIKDAQVDTLILGCTHYPFLEKIISEVMGPEVRLVNPAYNTVLDLKKILEEKYLLKIDKNRKEHYYTSGNPDNMKKVARAILNSFEYSVEKVKF